MSEQQVQHFHQWLQETKEHPATKPVAPDPKHAWSLNKLGLLSKVPQSSSGLNLSPSAILTTIPKLTLKWHYIQKAGDLQVESRVYRVPVRCPADPDSPT